MTVLIRPEALGEMLVSGQRVAVVDCRFTLTRPEDGRQAWARGHIPGAVYAHLEEDLSAPAGHGRGRHPLPSPAALADWLGRHGIDPSTKVVAYDDSFGSVAGRLVLLLRWLGHAQVALLDGGWQKWVHAVGTVSDVSPEVDVCPYHASPLPGFFADAEEVAQAAGDPSRCVIDARAEERYSGEVEPFDPVGGHIPGSVNWPYEENIDFSGYLLPAAELAENFLGVIGDRDPRNVIHVCGSGVTACQNLIAMEACGLRGSRLYPGSWSEWIADPARPVARGEAP